ncbi:urease accessory protein UreD [Nocardiopsis baichengensis]|uniref:urease accessory protein UreD n=1 Tax=Nocardiopsis baichengensis TaxID=280240 RepID=UPI000346BC8B|nr:urease accessory protein UreD [Nocardiopsis baichengensis]
MDALRQRSAPSAAGGADPTRTRSAAEPGLDPSEPAVIAVRRVGDRTVPVALETGTFLRPGIMRRPGGALRVALAAVRAALCAGDDVRLQVDVGPGAELELVDPNGSVAYNARGGRAAWRASVRLAEGARMSWAEPAFVVADGADVVREVDADLAEGAELLWRESLVLGRTGEQGGKVLASTRVRAQGRPLFVEDLDLRDPRVRGLPGILGGSRVVGQVGLFGRDPEAGEGPDGPDLLDLAGPGAVWRWTGERPFKADAALTPVWHAWGGHH